MHDMERHDTNPLRAVLRSGLDCAVDMLSYKQYEQNIDQIESLSDCEETLSDDDRSLSMGKRRKGTADIARTKQLEKSDQLFPMKLLACKFVRVRFMQDDLPAHFDSLSTAVLTSS